MLAPNALDLRDENSLISQSLKPWKLTPRELMIGHFTKNLGIGADISNIHNLGEVLGVDTVNVPAGYTPEQTTKWLKDKKIPSGKPIRLPDGSPGFAP